MRGYLSSHTASSRMLVAITSALCLSFFWPPIMAAHGAALVTDLSKNEISIETNFTGEKILLFGAIDPGPEAANHDVIIVLRGPSTQAVVRRKEKVFGIWINRSAATLGPVPSFYAVASNRPIEEILPLNVRQRLEIGQENIPLNLIDGNINDDERIRFMTAYARLKSEEGLYSIEQSGVNIIGHRLFRSEITLPSGVPLGDYNIDFFLFENGRLSARQSGALVVDFAGLENFMYTSAHKMPLLYGVSGVVLAILMGWGVAVIFRRT